ncbi:MAG: phenylacetic acid degradation operon negative regulatory protein PaaX [Woeseiaceae bacterium]|nr:phenylacetic acid degradation operon negative regulatory protein PaaX [Woeseiaceae bacterium]
MSVEIRTFRLIDTFRAQPTPRAGSLITTVFGDAIAPRGGSVWIGSLIACLAPFGLSERLVRTAMFRLTRDGWFEAEQVGRRSYYRLTGAGRARFEQASHRIYGEPRQRWSGDWTVALLAALPTADKDRARRELGWLGFGALTPNILAHPAPDTADLDTTLASLGLAERLVLLRGSTPGAGQDRVLTELAQKSWDLDDVEARYAAFIDRYRPVYAAVRKARRIEPVLAFHVRTLLVHDYRRIVLRDPLLPAGLLPADWHGTQAYQLCRNLYRAVYAAADEFLGSAMETADGPLPPPSPAYYERFSGLSEETTA